MTDPCVVVVVDDDESVRESLPDLLKTFGVSVLAFSSSEELLAANCLSQARCLILDVSMPGMSGPDLAAKLQRDGHTIPFIFMTAYGDEALRQRLLAQGAQACLFKPFSDTELQDVLNAALRSDHSCGC